MVAKLLELGADTKIRNKDELYAHQAYVDEYGIDEASLLIERSIFFDSQNKETKHFGSIFELKGVTSLSTPVEIRDKIIENWRTFVESKTINERVKQDLEVCTKKKKEIINIFDKHHNMTVFDANNEYNNSDKIQTELKKKRIEVI